MMKDRSLGWPSVLSKSTQEASVDPRFARSDGLVRQQPLSTAKSS
jgi:hypothetical protein